MATKTGNDWFVVDSSSDDWKVLAYLAEWCKKTDSRHRRRLPPLLKKDLLAHMIHRLQAFSVQILTCKTWEQQPTSSPAHD